MAKQTRISKKGVKSFQEALQRRGYPFYGTVARVVLEALIFEDGKLTADTFYSQKAGKQGTFTQIRTRLERDGFIRVAEMSGRIVATKKLENALLVAKSTLPATVSFVTEQVQAAEQRLDEKKANKDDVPSKAEFEELKADKNRLECKIEEIAKAVAELQAAMIPPDTPSKKFIREKAALKIAHLSCGDSLSEPAH